MIDKMNFQEMIYKIQLAYENADARNIFEHIAIQFTVHGEMEGIFYLEVADRKICIEPYNYYDADAFVTISSDVIYQLLENHISTLEAIEQKLVQVEGNLEKVMLLQRMTNKKMEL